MKNGYFALALLTSISLYGQDAKQVTDVIPYVKYSWRAPVEKQHENIRSSTLFEGSAHDMEYLQMNATSLLPAKRKTNLAVPLTEEQLLIIKSGTLSISFEDSTWRLGSGSIALLMPGQNFSLLNDSKKDCSFYWMKYRSRSAVDLQRGAASGGSLVRDFTRIPFRSHDKGGIRRYFEVPTAMCERLEMHVTTLNAGLKSHEPHTHNAEEIVLMMEDDGDNKGKSEMRIGDAHFQGEAGDLYFLGSNVLHGIQNIGPRPCSYFAFQFN